jgi:hypothetical protein
MMRIRIRLLTLMQIRVRLFILMRIRIQLPKMIRIHAIRIRIRSTAGSINRQNLVVLDTVVTKIVSTYMTTAEKSGGEGVVGVLG